MLSFFNNLGYSTVFMVIKAIIQISFLAVLFYKMYQILKTSSAVVIIKIFSLYFLLYFFVKIFKLEVLETLLEALFIPTAILSFIVYQNDLRYSFTLYQNSKNKFHYNSSYLSFQGIDAIISSCYDLSKAKRGALIVIKRKTDLSHIINSGTSIDAEITSQLITTIFLNDTPLHDGAIIIDGNRIKAAGCFLPLSEKTNIIKTLGTRHRAALGISEETDALVVVVSEETRKVSLCFNGEIKYALPADVCERVIKQYMLFNDEGIPNISLNDKK